ncbi:MAG: hypothetical protein ACRDX8_14735, partial [Acidimicrobiales bacterium]
MLTRGFAVVGTGIDPVTSRFSGAPEGASEGEGRPEANGHKGVCAGGLCMEPRGSGEDGYHFGYHPSFYVLPDHLRSGHLLAGPPTDQPTLA